MAKLRNISPGHGAGRKDAGVTRLAARPPRRVVAELLFANRRHRRMLGWLLAAVLTVVLAVAAVFLFTDLEVSRIVHLIDWQRVTAIIGGFDPVVTIALMAVLPVFGFPVSVVYLVAGARFGAVWGGVVVAFATAVHLLASYGIARSVVRGPLQRFVEKRHRQLPSIPLDEQSMVALVVTLVPGPPYLIRIYLLALANMRLKYYFWVSLTVFVLRSYVTILLGDLSSEPSGRRLIVLLGVDASKILICACVIWWLRVHHRRYHSAAGAVGPVTGGAT